MGIEVHGLPMATYLYCRIRPGWTDAAWTV